MIGRMTFYHATQKRHIQDDTLNNIQELRKRLQRTEASIRSLNAMALPMEKQQQGPGNRIASEYNSGLLLTLEDLITDQPSVLLASNHSNNQSRGQMRPGISQPANLLETSTEGVKYANDMQINSQESMTSLLGYDNDGLRSKLYELRQTNAELVCQNHKLLNELEKIGCRLQSANERTEHANEKLSDCTSRIAELEDEMACLQTHSSTQEKALRRMQEEATHSEQRRTEFENYLHECECEVKSLRCQLSDETRAKKRTEKDLEIALQGAEKLQSSFTEFQKTGKKLKMFEATEAQLRAELAMSSEERTELLNTLATQEHRCELLQRQVRQVEECSRIDKENLRKSECRNAELEARLAEECHKLERVNSQTACNEADQRELLELREVVQKQRAELLACQCEMADSKGQLLRLEELARSMDLTVNGVDSGLGSSATLPRSETRSETSCLETIIKEGSMKELESAVFGDIKLLLTQKSFEAEQLRSELASQSGQAASDQAIEVWRKDLLDAIRGQQHSAAHVDVLAEGLRKLQEERVELKATAHRLCEQLAESETQRAVVEQQLVQQKLQVTQLRSEVVEGSQAVEALQREVRTKTAQIKKLECQLDAKVAEVSQQVALVCELEQASEKRKAAEVNSMQEVVRLQEEHAQKKGELEQHICMLDKKLEELMATLNEKEQQLSCLRQNINAKECEVADSRQTLVSLEKRVDEGSRHKSNLETALAACRQKLAMYIEQIESADTSHKLQMSDCAMQIQSLQSELNTTRDELTIRDGQLAELRQELASRDACISQLETVDVNVEKKLEIMQQQHMEQSKQLSQLQEQLLQACRERAESIEQEQKATDSLRDSESERRRLAGDVEQLGECLKREQDDTRYKATTILQLDAQLTESKECINDLKEKWATSEKLLHEKSKVANQLGNQLKQFKNVYEESSSSIMETRKLLHKSQSDLKAKDNLLDELKNSLKIKREELETSAREIEDLQQALKDRQWELQHRAAQVTQLDMQIKQYKGATEQKIVQLEGSLKKSETSLEHKSTKVNLLDEKLKMYREEAEQKIAELEAVLKESKTSLEEKDAKVCELCQEITQLTAQLAATRNQLQQQQQQLQQQTQLIQQSHQRMGETRAHLDSEAARYRQLEQRLTSETELHQKYKKDYDECIQQLQKSREEYAQLDSELAGLKRDVTIREREQNRLARELADKMAICKQKESECARLTNEVSSLKKDEVHRRSELNAQIQRISSSKNSLQEQLQKEISEMKLSHERTLAAEEKVSSEHRKARHVLQTEVDRLHDDVTSLADQLKHWQLKYADVHEAVLIKEAEIARLEARISGYERATLSSSLPTVPHANTTSQPQHDATDARHDQQMPKSVSADGQDKMAALLVESTFSFPHLHLDSDVRRHCNELSVVRSSSVSDMKADHQVATYVSTRWASTPDCFEDMFMEVQREFSTNVPGRTVDDTPSGVHQSKRTSADVAPNEKHLKDTQEKVKKASTKTKRFVNHSPDGVPQSPNISTAINFYADVNTSYGHDDDVDAQQFGQSADGGATCMIDDLSLSGIEAVSETDLDIPTPGMGLLASSHGFLPAVLPHEERCDDLDDLPPFDPGFCLAQLQNRRAALEERQQALNSQIQQIESDIQHGELS